MSAKVSIVVPVYNMEAYLARCLDSLLAQRLREIEIVVVDDGSRDRSGAIAREYAARDERIVYIEQANSGVSEARNLGIAAASGRYIGFADPDDWADAEMYAAMYEEAEAERADIVMCAYVREFGTHAKVKRFDMPDRTVFEGEAVKANVLRRLIGPLGEELGSPEQLDAWGTVWSKLYRADLINAHGLAFVSLKRVGTYEDGLFNLEAACRADKFVFLNRPYYHYWRANPGSLTTVYKPGLPAQFAAQYELMERFIRDNRLPEPFSAALRNRICLNAVGLGLNTLGTGGEADVRTRLNRLAEVLRNERLVRSFASFDTAHCPLVWKVFFACAKRRFAIGYYMLLLAIERLRKAKTRSV